MTRTRGARGGLGTHCFAAFVLAGCVVHHLGCGPRPERRPDPAPSTLAREAAADTVAGAGDEPHPCPVRRAARTFVGFSAGMSLDHFELAAFEAERILAALEAQLCGLDDAIDPGAGLRAALRVGTVELTSIAFTQDDAGAADVHARSVRDETSPGTTADSVALGWSLRLMRSAGVWRIAAVAPAGAEVLDPR